MPDQLNDLLTRIFSQKQRAIGKSDHTSTEKPVQRQFGFLHSQLKEQHKPIIILLQDISMKLMAKQISYEQAMVVVKNICNEWQFNKSSVYKLLNLYTHPNQVHMLIAKLIDLLDKI